MEDKLLLFNPFNIKDVSEVDIANMYQEVFKRLIDEPLTMYHYAENIEIYSNLNYLIGEVIARLTRDVINLKSSIEVKKAIKCVEERKQWDIDKDGKLPAMSYFEALGTRFCEEEIKRLADKECSLRRFKNAYSSTEEKINSLKKKLDSIKFEES